VLDEPSSGLDPLVRRDILTAVVRTIADEGRTVLFSSHLLDELERVADHVALIHEGRIVFAGADITRETSAQIARRGVIRSFQISAVFPHLTALENVRVALQRQHGSSFDFWRSKSVLNRYNNRALELLNDVGLSEFANTPAVEMPYGRKRALEIATTLALDPEMMLLDEPMAGMGHEDIDKIAALIKRISAKYTILMVEHNLSVVANLSDIITVLTRGQVLAQGNYADLSKDERVKEAYLGAGHA